MSQASTPRSFRPRAHTVVQPPGLRQHRREVARWALAHGHRVDRDALAVLTGLRATPHGSVDRRWTVELIDRATGDAAVSWCDRHGVVVPHDLATTLATYLRHLSATRSLGRGSDPIATLRRAVSVTPPTRGCSRARHPAQGPGGLAPVLPIS